jgi:hypothetical protein
VVEVLERAEQRMGSDPLFANRTARFDGDLSRMKDGQVAKLDLVVEVEGDQMRLSNAGFNFRDMGPGLRALAEEVVRLVFRSRA